jgi:hypothetical protein
MVGAGGGRGAPTRQQPSGCRPTRLRPGAAGHRDARPAGLKLADGRCAAVARPAGPMVVSSPRTPSTRCGLRGGRGRLPDQAGARERLQAGAARVAQRRSAGGVPGRAASQPDPVLVVSDRGRVLRVPVAEVLYLKAELKYVTLRTAAQRTCSTMRWPTWNSAWASASCACTATRWWRARRCALERRTMTAARVTPMTKDGERMLGRASGPGRRVAGGVAAPGWRGARGAGGGL